MPNQITTSGIETASQAELLASYQAAFQAIYGPDINLDPDSPDGQLIGILIQATLDLQDLVVQVHNGFDPDTAIGNVLDERVAINGIQRKAGTFTVTNITIVTSQALNLPGLDNSSQPYTVADNAGNQWQLITHQSISGAGTYVFAFQAANPGAVLTVPNTITIPVSVVLGVTSINNPTTYTSLGQNEETDAALRIRRQQSVALSSQGFLSGLLGALNNINGMESAFVYENNTGLTDGNGVPGHSIWVIVSGTASASDIANAIYNKRNAGCGMFGAISFNITQLDGSTFTVLWDVVAPETLYITATLTSLDGVRAPDIATIRSQLPVTFVPGVAQEVDITRLGTAIQSLDPNSLVTLAGFSTSATGPFTNTLTPTSKKFQFAVSSPNIILLPMQLNPPTSQVMHGGSTIQFTALGGFGGYTFSMVSGLGSINPVTGLYTSAGVGTDVVRVTDAQSHTATATVTVI